MCACVGGGGRVVGIAEGEISCRNNEGGVVHKNIKGP